jgi:hypothetical protein
MSNLFKTLSQVLSKKNIKKYSSAIARDELYLAQSQDLVELERRQREIDTRLQRKF